MWIARCAGGARHPSAPSRADEPVLEGLELRRILQPGRFRGGLRGRREGCGGEQQGEQESGEGAAGFTNGHEKIPRDLKEVNGESLAKAKTAYKGRTDLEGACPLSEATTPPPPGSPPPAPAGSPAW